MTKEKKRLVYTDSNGDLQVLGVLNVPQDDIPGYSGSATAIIQNIKVSRTLRGFNSVKVWATNEIFGNVPLKVSDFQSSEPEIFLQHYDTGTGSWEDEFRGYAENQGSIDDEGNVAFKLYSFAKYTGKVNADKTSATTTDIGDAFQSLLPSGYQVEVPGDVTAPSVNSYTLVDKRRKGYRELAKDHGWTYRFTPRTTSGDFVVRFEPEGYGGTVGNIRGREDYSDGDILAKQFKSWEKARTKDIINKVEVIGTDSNNNKVVGTASDSQSITDYGERFERFHVDYTLGGVTEANSIAQDKLALSPGEGGEIKIDTFHESVVNDSVDVVDSRRNVDGVFTCTEQQTFYPENNDLLVFTYETETEKRAEKDDYLESERAKVYPSGSQSGSTDSESADVTGNSGSDTANVSGNAGNNGAGVSNDSGDDPPFVTGYTGSGGDSGVGATNSLTSDTGTYDNGETNILDAKAFNTDGQAIVIWVSVELEPDNAPTQGNGTVESDFGQVTLSVQSNSGTDYGYASKFVSIYEVSDTGVWDSEGMTAAFYIPENPDGFAYSPTINILGWDASQLFVTASIGYSVVNKHDHAALDNGGSLQAIDHSHPSGTYSADSHDHDQGSLGADAHPHTDGTYNADNHNHGFTDLNTAQEDKTDR